MATHSVILCQDFFAKTEHFLVRMFRLISHQSSMAPFYLHVTVFTKEHVKHANKGELIHRYMKFEPLHEKNFGVPNKD